MTGTAASPLYDRFIPTVFVSTLHRLAAQHADDLPVDDLSSDSLLAASMIQSGQDEPVFAASRRVAMWGPHLGQVAPRQSCRSSSTYE